MSDENDFEMELQRQLIKVFGAGYVNRYKEAEVSLSAKKQIDTAFKDLIKQEKGLILSGGVGVGKTMALIYAYKKIASFLHNDPESPIVKYNPQLIDCGLEFSRIKFLYAPELFNLFYEREQVNIELRPYILLDDLGCEYAASFTLTMFEILIEDIYRSGKYGLIITTNMSDKDFRGRDGWLRIADRLTEMCSWVEIGGKSRRNGSLAKQIKVKFER